MVAGCVILFPLFMSGTVYAMPRMSPPVMATAAAAVVVVVGGLAWQLACRPGAGAVSVIRLAAVGLAGTVLVSLVPDGTGYLAIFIALIGLGMDLPPVLATVSGLVILAATNLSMVVFVRAPVATVVGNDVGGAFLLSVGMFIRATRMSQARARAAQARAEELLARLQAAQAAQAEAAVLTERTRLAREVHDILAHSLSGLVLALDTAELLGRRVDDRVADPRTVAKILDQVARAQRIARDGLADTRRAVSALRGEELPGPALLGRLVQDTSEATGIRAALTVEGTRRQLPPEVGLAVYRTAQEALVNSAKYAGPDGRAELRLAYAADGVRLEIEDIRSPGQEPPRPGNLTFGGYGLTGIRERAELLGGELTAGPTTDGFRVSLRLPACEKAAVPQEAGAV